MFNIGQKVKVTFPQVVFPACTLFAHSNADAVIVGEMKENEELEPMHRIYMVEFKTDAFNVAYCFPVRAHQIEEL